jgi:predicted GNAT superfamily acetyltransferase
MKMMVDINKFERIIETRGRRFLLFIETGARNEDYQKYEDLRQLIWEEPEDHFSGRRNMAAENYFSYGGSLFTGVYADDGTGSIMLNPQHFVGFTYGYVSPMNKGLGYRKQENLRFYSQYAAVRRDMRRFGLGAALKRHQAAAVQKFLGVNEIACTYDPLTGANANRNIHKLGMQVKQYLPACYQNFGGRLNRMDIPADRFFVIWNLGEISKEIRPPVIPALASKATWALRSRLEKISGRSGEIEIPVPAEEIKRPEDIKTEYSLVEIPDNFYRLLQETKVEDEAVLCLPLKWRIASRRIFLSLFKAGFTVTDFQRFTLENRPRNVYVLKKGR